jgi:hypothetical protein
MVPEGLVEFIPEIRTLIKELNKVLAEYETDIRDLPTLANKKEFIILCSLLNLLSSWLLCPRKSRRCSSWTGMNTGMSWFLR